VIEKTRYEIQPYDRAIDLRGLSKTHRSFCGSPRRHPRDPEKIILIVNPLSPYAFYYEFRCADVSYAERLLTLVNAEGETILMARIWVKHGSVGVRSIPFFVEPESPSQGMSPLMPSSKEEIV
jgi:hypothetical protein